MYVNVNDFGAVGDGVADNTAAIQSAINSLAYGGVVEFPDSVYNVTSGINVTAGVSLRGRNSYSSLIRTTSPTGDVLTLASAATVERMSLGSTVTRTSGSLIQGSGSQNIIDSVNFSGYYIAVTIGTSAIKSALSRVSNCVFTGTSTASDSGGVFFRNFGNGEFFNNVMTGPGRTSTITQPSYGVRVWEGDTILIANSDVVAHGRALLVDPQNGMSTFAMHATNTLFDSSGNYTNSSGGTAQASCAEIRPMTGAFAYTATFANCWFGNSLNQNGCVISNENGGTVNGVQFTGCTFHKNGYAGLRAIGSTTANWSVSGGSSAGNTNYGIDVQAASSGFIVTGHRSGNVGGQGPNVYGINIGVGASNNYSVTNNNLTGNTSMGLYDGGTGTKKQVNGNLF